MDSPLILLQFHKVLWAFSKWLVSYKHKGVTVQSEGCSESGVTGELPVFSTTTREKMEQLGGGRMAQVEVHLQRCYSTQRKTNTTLHRSFTCSIVKIIVVQCHDYGHVVMLARESHSFPIFEKGPSGRESGIKLLYSGKLW